MIQRLGRNPIALGFLAILILILLGSTFAIVPETRQAVIVRFGEPQRIINRFEPNQEFGGPGAGLAARIPFVEQIVWIDKRILSVEMDRQQVLSTDQLRLQVDAFARYRIVDPLRMYISARSEERVSEQLRPILGSSLRNELGKRPFAALLSPERGQLMENIQIALNRVARQYGAEIVDVRIKRADLPQQNQEAVYRRMQTARQQEAATIRARGEQQRREIVARANRDVAVTVAEARAYAGQVRGEGDARRTQLLGAAYGRDPAFASFWRSMQAYENALAQGDTTMVISPDSAFFRYFERGATGAR